MNRTARVIVHGRVQGVGYRAWVEVEATRRSLAGWVRNRRDGTVEAVLSGDDAAVEGMLAALRDGPPAAVVADVSVEDWSQPVGQAFNVLPT